MQEPTPCTAENDQRHQQLLQQLKTVYSQVQTASHTQEDGSVFQGHTVQPTPQPIGLLQVRRKMGPLGTKIRLQCPQSHVEEFLQRMQGMQKQRKD